MKVIQETVRPVCLRPSSSSIWGKGGCTAQPWFIKRNEKYIPRDHGNDDSKEGDAAHLRAADHLRGVRGLTDPNDPVWVYVNDVENALINGHHLLVETKSPCYYDGGYEGTVDAAIIDPYGSRLDIWDLKFGMGVDVEAIGNTQMSIYWRSLYEYLTEFGILEHMEYSMPVELTIAQPRHWNGNKLDRWNTTVGELMEFTDTLGFKARKIYAKKGLEFKPSDSTCQFCPGQAVCKAKHEWDLEYLPELDGDVPAIDEHVIRVLYERRRDIIKWMGKIEDFVKNSVKDGGAFAEYYQWVPGTRQGNTAWVNVKKTLRELRKRYPDLTPADFYTKEFLSPNKVTEMVLAKTGEGVDKELFTELGLTYRSPAKPVLKPIEEGENSFDDDLLSLLD